jgi:large subunit ribosomal protein L6
MVETMTKKIRLPKEVSISIQAGNKVTLSGPKGELKRTFKTYRVNLSNEGNVITLSGSPSNKQTGMFIETICAHLRNMTEGLVYGYEYKMKLIYSHFPMSIQVEKGVVNIKNFLGEKFPRKARIVGNTKVEAKGQEVIVSGINKDEVGQTASNLEQKSKVKGKDIRRYQDGVYLIEVGNMTPKKSRASVIEIVRD